MSPILRAWPEGHVLMSGSHADPDTGMCVMEAVAFVAGERHSDAPECACPVIGAFLRGWNDGLRTDEDRTRLLTPLIPRLVGSRSTPEVQQRRADLALDWFVRVHTPAWLSLVPALASHAASLRSLSPLVTADAVRAARGTIKDAQSAASAAGDAAGDAAWDAARAAAGAAAGAAARAAAGAAAWDAAWAAARAAAGAAARAAAGAAAWDAAWAAARDAARDAAMAAAGDAAWDAARDAARDALQPTVDALQPDALLLIDRMLAVTPESLITEGGPR